jgi:hypoxanthine phosphoribosyltransferase/predicted kinase
MELDNLIKYFAVLGGCLALYNFGILIHRAFSGLQCFTWKIIEQAGEHLFKELIESDFIPDVIVGLGRGGSIAAGILAALYRESSYFKNRMIPITSIDRIYLVRNGKRHSAIITGFHNIDVYQKNVLIINADTYSGRTLQRAKEVLSWDEPKIILTGTFLSFTKDIKPHFEADFCGSKLPASQKKKRLPWREKNYKFEDEQDVNSLKNVLVVLHGHVATGKTSVTDSIVKGLGYTPLYSDWFWFKHGLGSREHDPARSVTHNKHMLGRCWSALGNGYNVVLDSTTRWESYRNKIKAAFSETGISIIFIRCFCSKEEALQRIEKRKFIGPHDFGTAHEYERVAREFDEISDDEKEHMNLLNVNTESLTCEITRSMNAEMKELMKRITQAIENNYFSKIRSATRLEVNEKPHT